MALLAVVSAIDVLANAQHSNTTGNPNNAWTIKSLAFSRGSISVLGNSRTDVFVRKGIRGKAHFITEGVYPDWSPDGLRIVFADAGNHAGKSEIFLINADGSNRKQLTHSKGGSSATTPAWSPDGSKIGFAMPDSPKTAARIYVVDPDGNNLKPITTGISPQWSPDGRKLTFYRWATENRSSIWIANADGSEPRQITDETSMSLCPRWSPDGNKIVFSSNRDGHSAIYTVNPDGSGLQRIVYANDADFYYPILSPDGTQLIVDTGRPFQMNGRPFIDEATTRVVLIRLNRTHATEILDKGHSPTVLWTKN